MRFIMIDRITDLVPWQFAAGVKGVALGEDYFVDHFPERPVMPGVMMVEGLVQLSSYLISFSSNFRERGVLAAIQVAKFKKFVAPGDQLLLRVKITETAGERVFATGTVWAGEKLATQVDMTIARLALLHEQDMGQLKSRVLSMR